MADEPRRWKLRRREALRPSLSAATIATIGTSSDSAMSLRPLTMYVTFSDSFSGSGICGTFGHPRPEDLLADILDLDRASLVRQMGQRRLHRDEPVHEIGLIVLETQVEHIR